MSDESPVGQHLGQALQDIARLYIGHGKRFSVAALHDVTGIPAATLKSYFTGHVSIPAANLLKLIAVLPTEAGNMLIAPSGYKLAPLEDGEDCWESIGAEASMLTFEIFEAQSDGHIDHREKLKLRQRAASLAAKLDGVRA